MTIEIRQLVIRAVVDPAPDPERRDAVEARSKGRTTTAAPARDATEREAIVAACVREVLRVLRRARGR